jgi:hypothetical protein
VAGRDVFALVRDATDSLAAGARVAAAAPRARATRSPGAYGFYEEGLRAFARGDMGEARRLFGLALGVDSAFAVAAASTDCAS